MDLLLLGGMSAHNKPWLYEVQKSLAPLFENTLVHEYAHWASAGPHIDIDHELNVVHNEVRPLGSYAIFAKSAGVVLSLKGISENVFRPKACLFAGTPLGFVREHGHQMDVWLKSLTMPAIFIQNSHDPAGSFHELEHFLREHMHSPHYKLIELAGDTHSYQNLDMINDLIIQLLKQQSNA